MLIQLIELTVIMTCDSLFAEVVYLGGNFLVSLYGSKCYKAKSTLIFLLRVCDKINKKTQKFGNVDTPCFIKLIRCTDF